jgi:hypothetical protein
VTVLAFRMLLAFAVALTALVSFGLAQPPRVLVQFKDGTR